MTDDEKLGEHYTASGEYVQPKNKPVIDPRDLPPRTSWTPAMIGESE